MMMSMVFNVPPTAKVIRGRAILEKGISERKNLLTRVLIRQSILSLIFNPFSEKSVQSAQETMVEEKVEMTNMWDEKK